MLNISTAFQAAMANRNTKFIRVAAFTGSATMSSARFRVRQYIPALNSLGVALTEYIARFGSWPPSQKILRPLWFPSTLIHRIPGIIKSYRADVTLLQREMVSTFVTLEGITHRPRVLDVDDAVWLNRGGERNFSRLVRMCDGVLCGNGFISDVVQRWHSNTCLLPTAVDTDRFRPLEGNSEEGSPLVIGWSGLSAGCQSLLGMEPALVAVLEKHPRAVLRIVSDALPEFKMVDPARIEYIRWSPQNEVQTIQEMSVGLMPIEDSLWGRGKCSYKMLLYLSCGIPVVVSPVGMNNEILSKGNVGFGARSIEEWVESISWLLGSPEQRRRFGLVGRQMVEDHYSLNVLVPKLANFLKGCSA